MALTLARRTGVTRHRPTVLATDTWTGTTGAAWAAQWSGTLASGATRTIQANTGQLVSPSTGTYAGAGNTTLSGMTATLNMSLLIDWTPPSLTEAYLGLGLRADQINGGWLPYDGYGAQLGTTGSPSITIYRCAAGSDTSLGTVTQTIAAGTTYHVRFQVIGSVVSFRIWTGTTEPGTWGYSATDTSPYSTAGTVTIGLGSGATAGAVTTAVDNLTVTAS